MKPNTYTRFIPREELDTFSAWTPGALTGQPAEDSGATRRSGYQEGYRDGLVALDAFKQSYARDITAQVGALLASFERQIEALEERMADTLAHTAMDLAGQVVRH